MQDINLNTTSTGSGGFPEPEVIQVAETRKLPSSQYKGVVPQPNGRWGAQIYEKHHRVWLGTFNDEADAARAYDVAAQRFRGRDAVINFSPLSTSSESDATELLFLNSHSKAEIVDMLRKHTYGDELQQSRRAFSAAALDPRYPIGCNHPPSPPTARELLFEKAVTPSDVGKLNRLVIPKQHAEKHFPLKMIGDGMRSTSTSTASCKGVLLNLEDVSGKVWRFRYSYWNSSQSYVLTKGWSRFVKEKSLSAGDIVSFLRSAGPSGKLFIDWKPKNVIGATNSGGYGFYQYLLPMVRRPVVARPTHAVRLFGVNIAKGGGGGGGGGGVGGVGGGVGRDWDEKKREMEILSSQYFYKKQCFGAL